MSSITTGGNSGTVYNGGTLTVNTNGTILPTNGTYTMPNYSGNFGIVSDSVSSYYDFGTKVLDIEKLSKMEPEKREMLLNLFLNFMNNENHSSKTIMYNTLESYGLIIEQKALDRKIKINNITKSEKEGTK